MAHEANCSFPEKITAKSIERTERILYETACIMKYHEFPFQQLEFKTRITNTVLKQKWPKSLFICGKRAALN